MFSLQDIVIPIYAFAIATEAFFKLKERPDYNSKDTWTNIAVGFISVTFDIVFALIFSRVYIFCYEISPLRMPENFWWSWVLLLFLDDFCFYWSHRTNHESRFFWNFHVVHHSSNYFNLSTAVRQSWFGGAFFWIFYIPLAFLGFPLWMRLAIHSLNQFYQFFIHLDWIPKLGWLEYIFNTPSHHRVHHGVNPEYLDKNYGGIFIIFDHIFGSFAEEKETPKYGIIKPLNTYNWIWINTHSWFEMWHMMKTKKTFWGKLRCIYGSPDMVFEEIVKD